MAPKANTWNFDGKTVVLIVHITASLTLLYAALKSDIVKLSDKQGYDNQRQNERITVLENYTGLTNIFRVPINKQNPAAFSDAVLPTEVQITNKRK